MDGQAGLGLFGGAAALLIGRWALERGRHAAARNRVSNALGRLLLMTLAPLALALAAALQGFPGAAIGAVAGVFVFNALVAAPLAVFGTGGDAKGARRFAVVSALAAASMIWAVFNGEISAAEGAVMLLAAVAVAVWAVRSPPSRSEEAGSNPLFGSAWLLAGTLAAFAGAWGAAFGIGRASAGRPDGDLMFGLSLLALVAAIPNAVLAWRARKDGEGAAAFVELAAGGSVMLFGAVGAAALLRPISAPESFLGFPALALAASALALLGLALGGLRASKPMLAASLAAYVLFLWAFVRGVA